MAVSKYFQQQLTCETCPKAMRCLGLATTGASNGATGASGRTYVFLPMEQHVYKLPWNILNITKVWFTCECVLVWSCGLALVQLLLVYPASSTDISAVARCGLMPLSGSGFQNLWQEIPGVQKSFSNNFQICSSGVWGFVYPLVN